MTLLVVSISLFFDATRRVTPRCTLVTQHNEGILVDVNLFIIIII